MVEIAVTGSLPSIVEDDEASKDVLRIALAQVLPTDQESQGGDDGLAKLEQYALRAAKEGADIVCFPEYFLTGATHDAWEGVRETASTSADDGAPAWLETVQRIAVKVSIDIIAGTVVELGLQAHHVPHRTDEVLPDSDCHSEKLFNTATYISRTGEVVGSYTKRNLWHPERTTLSAAEEEAHTAPRTFSITTRRGRTIKVGMLICWDIAFPEAFRALLSRGDNAEQLDGPDIIFIPTCWYATDAGEAGLSWNATYNGEAGLLDSLCVARAYESEAFVCMTNIAGRTWADASITLPATAAPRATTLFRPPQHPLPSDPVGVGRTQVAGPFVNTLARLDGPQEGLLLAQVDLRLLRDARNLYRIRHDLAQVDK